MPTPSTSLEVLRHFLSWHPWHWWGLSDSRYAPITKECSDIIQEYAYQSADAIGRSEMRRALGDAESILATWLRFPVVPTYIAEEVHPYTRGPIQLANGRILALGSKVETLIGQITPTLSDPDGDGLHEQWTATIATTATDASSLIVRIRTADQPQNQPNPEQQDRWNIEANVSIASGTATISGAAWLLVKPTLYERPGGQAIDPTDATNYVASLDVFVRTYNSAAVATYTRNGETITGPSGGTWSVVNARSGIVRFASDCGYSWECNGVPTHIHINYLAGDRSGDWLHILCKLALAEMARPICGCESANREVARWQRDYSMQGEDGRFQLRTSGLDNPLGTREGHAAAWQAIVKNQRLIGVSTLR